MLEAWRDAARRDVRDRGYAPASWRFATVAALVVMSGAAPVWLRAYLSTTNVTRLAPPIHGQSSTAVLAAQSALLAWTLLAGMAVGALWQPRPRARALTTTLLLVIVAATVLFARGGVRLHDTSGYLAADERGGWLPALLQRGPLDTLHTGTLTAWALLAVIGIGCWWIDRRPALAACWLAPFVALSQVRAADATVLGIGLVVVAAVVALGASSARLTPT